MAELRIRIRISSPLALWGLAGALLGAFATELSTESSNLSTYYPAPSGVYKSLVATGDAYLARDEGSVGVGTTGPSAALEVAGAARSGGDLSAGGKVSAADVVVLGASAVAAIPCPTGASCARSDKNTLTITFCGTLGQACCSPGSTCGSGLVCSGNICRQGCTVASWSSIGGCGAGCAVGSRLKSPTCTPTGCPNCPANSCQADSSCPQACGATPASWANGACGAPNCPVGQRSLTPVCSPSGCVGSCGSAQCQYDPTCPQACTGIATWTLGSCGDCGAGKKSRTPVCSPAGCAGSCGSAECLVDSACCVSNGSCSATPACGQTAGGVDNCGKACTKTGPACCVSNPSICSASPSCGQTKSGTDNCGKPCTRTGPACPPPPPPCTCGGGIGNVCQPGGKPGYVACLHACCRGSCRCEASYFGGCFYYICR